MPKKILRSTLVPDSWMYEYHLNLTCLILRIIQVAGIWYQVYDTWHMINLLLVDNTRLCVCTYDTRYPHHIMLLGSSSSSDVQMDL